MKSSNMGGSGRGKGAGRIFIEALAALALLGGLAAFSVFTAGFLTKNSAGGKTLAPSEGDQTLELGLRKLVEGVLGADPRFRANDDPEVLAACAAFEERLLSGFTAAVPFELEIRVVRNSDINAVCLPGGLILVYTGLLRQAKNPEEVAAVLAHELGHLVYRDSFNALTRNLALGSLLSLGGANTEAARRILYDLTVSGHSRSVEARADDFALRLLPRTGLNPKRLADFFRSLQKNEGDSKLSRIFAWTASHPDLGLRIRLADEAAGQFEGPEVPIGIDWQALLRAL